MKENNELNNKFSFFIVDDDERKIEMNRMIMQTFGIKPVCINNNFYDELVKCISNTYDEGKYPVIFLDEDFGSYMYKGDEIVKLLINNFNEKGGVLMPFSSSYKEQLENWKQLKTDTWVTPENGKIPIEYIMSGDLDECCNEYLHLGKEISSENRNIS